MVNALAVFSLSPGCNEVKSGEGACASPGLPGDPRVQLIVNIVVLAAIYALIACGYVLIYRVSRVLNLAHGELMMLGAYLLLTTASAFSGNAFVAIAVAIVLSLLVGVLIYVFLMRKMAGEMVLAAVLTTVALGILLPGYVPRHEALDDVERMLAWINGKDADWPSTD